MCLKSLSRPVTNQKRAPPLFFFFFFLFLFIFLKKIYIPVNTHQVGFIYLLRAGGVRCALARLEKVPWWRHYVRAAACGTLHPLRLPSPSPERHTRVMREAAEGPVISAHRFCAAHSPLYPSCMVDIIFSSSFLGDMGDHSKSKSIKLPRGAGVGGGRSVRRLFWRTRVIFFPKRRH